MKRLISFAMLSLFSATVLLAGCNTIEGAGKDVKSAGSAVEHTAKDCKDGKCSP